MRNVLLISLLLLLAAPAPAQQLVALLDGDQEVPPVSTAATGEFLATVNPGGTTITFELTYSNLEGTPVAANIHFGQRFANGGVLFNLCGGGFQICQQGSPIKITGTLDVSHLVLQPLQGIEAGEMSAAVDAMLSGLTYVNITTSKFANGEIRGQIRLAGSGGANTPPDTIGPPPERGPEAGRQPKVLVCHRGEVISVAQPALKAHVGDEKHKGHGDCILQTGAVGDACACPSSEP